MLRYMAYFSKDVLFLFVAYLGLQRGRFFEISWFGVCAALIILPSISQTLTSLNPVAVLLSLRAYLLVPLCAFFAAPLVRGFRDIEICA